MSSRAPVCAWVVACVFVSAGAVSAQERSASDLVEAIVREGPRAAAIRADVEVVRREQQARLARPNPGLVYSREGAGFTEFFQVEQPLLAFGLRGTLQRAGAAASAAAEAERDVRLWDLRVEATQAVERWRWAQFRVEATAIDTQAVERLVAVLRVREREGEGSRFDRLRGEQELAELKQASVSATVALTDARAAVVALLPAGMTATRVTGAQRTPVAMAEPDTLITRARAARPELRALQSGVERSALEAEAARRARRPAPVLTGGLKRADNDGERQRGSSFGLNVTVPLFDSGARDAARWTAEGARITAERAAIEHEIRADILRAAEVLTLRQQALATAGDDALASELVTTAEVAYREGEIGIVGLLDAVRTASRARQRDLERRLDVRLAEIALERAVGGGLWP